MSEYKYTLDLQRFAESSASVGAVQGQGETMTANAQPSTAESTATPSGENTQEARQRAYNDFIKQNRDLDDARIQGIVKGRLKNTKAKADLADQLTPIVDLFYERYGVEKGDIKGLTKAAEEDLSNFDAEAAKRGFDTETWQRVRGNMKELESLKKADEDRKAKEAQDKQINEWLKEAEEIRDRFPDFDLEAELENEGFVGLLDTGKVSMEQAYILQHFNEIIPNAMSYAAKQGEKLAVDRIRSRGTRPPETGISSNSPAVTKSDKTQLTKADRQDIYQRVMRGEKITLS